MFITVRYGDGEKTLFNPQCKILALLEDIKRRCKCAKDVLVDLSDESGNLKFLADHPLSYASEILKERESFVLIRIENRLSKYESDTVTKTVAEKTSPSTTPNKKGNAVSKAKTAFMSNQGRLKSRSGSNKSISPTLKKASR